MTEHLLLSTCVSLLGMMIIMVAWIALALYFERQIQKDDDVKELRNEKRRNGS